MTRFPSKLPLPFTPADGCPDSVSVVRSARKTISLELKRDGTLLVRAPYGTGTAQILAFLRSKESWLQSAVKKQQTRRALNAEMSAERLTAEEIRALADEALTDIPARCARFAPLVGVTYGRITIRNQKTRWGSCSSAGNLNFNCLLMLAPPEARDYVVVHELCHRLEMNHSKRFWAEVARVCPDYETQRKWFKDHGGALLARMFGEG